MQSTLVVGQKNGSEIVRSGDMTGRLARELMKRQQSTRGWKVRVARIELLNKFDRSIRWTFLRII
jgi:hypothetical protein